MVCLFGMCFVFLAGFESWKDLQNTFLARKIEALICFLERLRNDYAEESRYPLKPSSIPEDGNQHKHVHKELIRFQHEFQIYRADLGNLKRQSEVSSVGSLYDSLEILNCLKEHHEHFTR